MDVSSTTGIPSAANAMLANQTANASAVSVLKQSLDMQAETVAALLPTEPATAPGQGLPEHIGRNINITA
ncbi:YjfB family protein [Thiocystis violascens]|uniref:Motility protein n=1 Tax=Thiocystis violascens (strain ATCC 17096 / DSM 198 / 6111) TaxID=765911 RepID=I3Y5Z4_THIV6|nr:YjfB family protein [Thiocystis violascens]AFL72412.1 hypothetical protein Thivi_0343 [Thiocystis violascens DSM 198]